MTLTFRDYLLLALLAFLFALPGRMSLPPLDRDEPRYMEASEQMLTSGNVIDIRFQDKPRYLQPAGIYWLEASSARSMSALFGPQVLKESWPYRIPSLIAATLIVPLTAWFGSVLFGGTTGLMAAGLLMVSTLFAAESRMATIDTVLLLDILGVEAMLLRAFLDRQNNRPTALPVALGYWLALGVGLMLKGPIVLIPGFGTPLALWLVERDRSWWSRLRPLWGWLVMVAVVLPWCLAIGLVSDGDFFSRAVGVNLLGKVAHGQQAHGFPPGYYLLVFLLSFWPGAVFAACALPSIWERRSLPQVRFLLCWIVPHWLFFELLATKLPHYVLPTYPAIAVLTAASLMAWPASTPPLWGRLALKLYGSLWVVAGFLFCCAGTVLLYQAEHLISIRAVLALLGALPLMIGAAVLLLRQAYRQAAFCAIGTALITQTGIFLAVIPNLQLIQLSPKAAAAFARYRPCAHSALISTSYSEPSLVFLAGQNTHLLDPAQGALALSQQARCDLALVDKRDEGVFLQALRAQHMSAVEYERVKGLNYSTGHKMDLGLYAARRDEH